MSRRQKILDTVDDLVANFLYYDRKEDEDLPVGAIDDAVLEDVVSIDEIGEAFTKELRERFYET